jgi:excisionase family DNA binding protein
VFDHSASNAEHQKNLPPLAGPCISRHFRAILVPFGIFSTVLTERCADVVCEPHVAASDSLEYATMATTNDLAGSSLALRPREAAKALGVSERSLWEWTHRGDVPHVRIGRTILYPVDGLRAWLNRQAGLTLAQTLLP